MPSVMQVSRPKNAFHFHVPFPKRYKACRAHLDYANPAPIQKREEPDARASFASEMTLSTAIRFSASRLES